MNCEIKYQKGLYSIISYFIIFNFLSAFMSLIIAGIIKSSGVNLADTNNANTATSLINLVVYLVLFGALLYINHKELLQEVKTFFKNKPNNILWKIVAGYGIFYAINLFTNLLVQNATDLTNLANSFFDIFDKDVVTSTADNQKVIEEILKGNGFIFMFLSAGIFGPICEELVFRRAFFNICKTKEMGILLSSLFFGLIHITSSIGQYNLLSMILMTIPYVVSGVAFGLIYIKNDCDIVVPTIIHMLSNIISMLGIIFLI